VNAKLKHDQGVVRTDRVNRHSATQLAPNESYLLLGYLRIFAQ